MSAEPEEPGARLRRAAPTPRAAVDVDAVLARGRVLSRRRAVTRVALALVLLLPLGGIAVSLARTPSVDLADGGGSIPATLAATEDPPEELVDASAPAPVPDAVRARFDQPVVGTHRADAAPAQLMGRCDEPAAAAPAVRADRVERLADRAGPPLVHVGPAMTSSLRVGTAAAPPAYPDTYGITCVAGASPRDALGALSTPGADATHLYAGWTGFTPPTRGTGDPFLWVSAVEVPDGAAWAVQEQPGWWLAYDVADAPWLLVQSTAQLPADASDAEASFPGARVIFLDTDGRSLGEERIGTDAIRTDAPFLRSQATGARISLGGEEALRTDLGDGPIPVCAAERTVCVWVALVDGELLALSAAGPLPAEVPPLGLVGSCAEGGFAASGSASRYAEDGTWLAGPAPVGLHRYGVVVADGEVTIDLGSFTFGPERGSPERGSPERGSGERGSGERGSGDPAPITRACTDLRGPGFPMP